MLEIQTLTCIFFIHMYSNETNKCMILKLIQRSTKFFFITFEYLDDNFMFFTSCAILSHLVGKLSISQLFVHFHTSPLLQ